MATFRTSWSGGASGGTANRTCSVAAPAVGDLLVVIAAYSGVTTGAAATCTDDRGGTYTLVTTAYKPRDGTTTDYLYAFVRNQAISSTATHIVTVAVSPSGNTAGIVFVSAFSDLHNVGALAIRQVAIANDLPVGALPSVGFRLAGSANPVYSGNPTVIAIFNAQTTTVETPIMGWTERYDAALANPTTGLEVATRDSGFNGADIQWQYTSPSASCCLGLELEAGILLPAGAATLTGYAPTVQVARSTSISIPVGALTLTGYAPTVQVSQVIDVPAGAMTLTGYAPTVVQTGNKVINIPAGAMTLTGYAPSVTSGNVGAVFGVFEDVYDSSGNAVFDYVYLRGETFDKTITTLNAAPTLDFAYKTVPHLQYSLQAHPSLVSVAKDVANHTILLAPTLSLEIWQAVTFASIGEFTSDIISLTVTSEESFHVPTLTQSPTTAVTFDVSLGSAHSKYDIVVPLLTETPQITLVQRGSQTLVPLLTQQAELLPVELFIDVAGIYTYVREYYFTQTPTLDTAVEFVPFEVGGARLSAGWLLEPKRESRSERKRSEALAREQRRREQIAAEAAAQAAAAEAARKATEERMAALRAEMERQSVVDAPFRAAYEQQLQGMAQQMSAQGQAAMAEITRLRSELAQTQAQLQQNEEQDNEDEAIALLLLKQ